MKKFSYIYLMLLLAGVTGCKKNVVTQYGDAASGAFVKFLHTAPGTPAIDGYLNGKKVTPQAGVTVTDNSLATSITIGIVYNYTGSLATYIGLFPGSTYANVPSGNTVIKVQASTPVPALVSPQTSAPGAVIGTVTQATTDGSYYSVFAVGLPGSTTTPLGVKAIEDKFPTAASGKAYVRLAYMIPNGAPVDLQATATLVGTTTPATTTVATNVAYSNVSDFFAVSVNPTSLTNYTFQMYLTGTNKALGSVSASVSLAPGRYYTIIGRGLAADYQVPGTGITLKASARPTLPLTDPNTKLPEVYFAPAQLVAYVNK